MFRPAPFKPKPLAAPTGSKRKRKNAVEDEFKTNNPHWRTDFGYAICEDGVSWDYPGSPMLKYCAAVEEAAALQAATGIPQPPINPFAEVDALYRLIEDRPLPPHWLQKHSAVHAEAQCSPLRLQAHDSLQPPAGSSRSMEDPSAHPAKASLSLRMAWTRRLRGWINMA